MTSEELAPKIFKFRKRNLANDRKTYQLSNIKNQIKLEYERKLNDAIVQQANKDHVAGVRITSCPEVLVHEMLHLLSEHEEDEPAQVLFVIKDEDLYLKVLTVIMKEILNKVNELIKKNLRNQSTQKTSISD